MQTTVDISEEQVSQLNKMSADRCVSRDELVRAAISTYLKTQENALEDSFGAWVASSEDGVAYQRRMRSEW